MSGELTACRVRPGLARTRQSRHLPRLGPKHAMSPATAVKEEVL